MDNLIIDGNKLAEIAMELANSLAKYEGCHSSESYMCRVNVNGRDIVLKLRAVDAEGCGTIKCSSKMLEAVTVTKFPLEQD